MPAPAVHPTTTEWYEALGTGITGGDELLGWQLLRFLDPTGQLLGEVDDIVRDSPEGPGWSAVLDVDRADPENLAYLAQFVGASLAPGLSDAEQRARLLVPPGWQRGTPAAIAQAARSLLTGGQHVFLDERYGGDPYALRVRTYGVETPDPDAVLAALLRQKPAGIVLTYSVTGGATYDELSAEAATYDALDTEFSDYDDQSSWTP